MAELPCVNNVISSISWQTVRLLFPLLLYVVIWLRFGQCHADRRMSASSGPGPEKPLAQSPVLSLVTWLEAKHSEVLRQGLGKLQPMGQILSTTYFKSSFTGHRQAHCLGIVCDCFPTTTANLSSCNRDWLFRPAKVKIFTSCPLQKEFSGSCFRAWQMGGFWISLSIHGRPLTGL